MSDSITVRQRIVRHVSIDSGQPYAEASGRVPVLAGRPGRPERIVIVGGGFAGFHAARTLSRTVNCRRWRRRTGTDQVEIVLISRTDYFLYLPLLPEVAAGILDPRRVAVPLADAGPGVRTVPGKVDEVDIAARSVGFTDPEGIQRTMSYDRLLLTVGSVGKLLPVPGLAEHAIGFRSIREGLALRDHLVRQIELAAAAGVAAAAISSGPDEAGLQGQTRLHGAPRRPGPADPSGPDGAPGRFAAAEQDARCTFVVVGAGYTGTEVAAHGQLLTRAVAGNYRYCVTSGSGGCCWRPPREYCRSWIGICPPLPTGC